MQHALGSNLQPDPFMFGLGEFVVSDAERIESRRASDRRRNRVGMDSSYNRQKALQKERAYKLAKYLYEHGETDTRLIHRRVGIKSVKTVIGVMTYMSFLFGGKIRTVYESDDGFHVGLVNRDGDIPKIKTDKKYGGNKYIVYVDDIPHYFSSTKIISEFLGIDRNGVGNMLKGKKYTNLENVRIEWAKKHHDKKL